MLCVEVYMNVARLNASGTVVKGACARGTMGAHSGSTRQNWTHLHDAERRGCKEPSPHNGVLTDGQIVSGSGHVRALVKRGVGPFWDPKHRLQERVRSCPTVWAECCKPRQGRCHKHRHQNPRILTNIISPSRAGVRLGLRERLLPRDQKAAVAIIVPSSFSFVS